MKPTLTQMLFAPPNVLYLMKKKKKQKTKTKKQKKTKKPQKQKQKKSASDFSTRQRSTPLLPMRLQEGFLYYTYIYVLVGKPC
uniref:Uncharacterized protein n=1 Tax=Saimiri boliviensis boliviensis TaxID=39432 RepID=A0A2K6TV02_SAIBB